MAAPASNCIFCRIVAGSIPAHRVLETPEAIAFLDVGPLAPGHVLLVPRAHVENLLDAPDDLAAALGRLLPRVTRGVLRATGAAGLNVLQNNGAASGQAVSHLHFHFIPRTDGDGLGYRWNAGSYKVGNVEVWRERIAAALSSA